MTEKQLRQKRAELRANGVNLAALCREHDVCYQTAKDLLRGQLKGHRGGAHKAAILLGLKPAPTKGAT